MFEYEEVQTTNPIKNQLAKIIFFIE